MTTDGLIVQVGPVAHGGHCVARLDNRVVFVRHALPGERVRLRITERSSKFWRADAVEILEPSPERVEAPCSLAGTCGGCDFQHASMSTQLDLLTSVVREQLQRLASWEWTGRVEAVDPALGWRTRMNWSVTAEGKIGLRKHRSHDVVAVQSCPIAHPGLPDVTVQRWDTDNVEAIVSSGGKQLLVTDASIEQALHDSVDAVVAVDGTARHGDAQLIERVEAQGQSHEFVVTGSGFWQVHPAAASTLVDAVLEVARVQPGERVLDLYAGVGLFSRFLRDAGADVVAVETSKQATRDAAKNLADVKVVRADVVRALHAGSLGDKADVVVLDPPRVGAKKAVDLIADLEPSRVVYVACDPAALARDVAHFARRGYELASVRAFALFPMTHHVECVALLRRSVPDSL